MPGGAGRNMPGGAGRPAGRVRPRTSSSVGGRRGVRGGGCGVGAPQLAAGRSGGSRVAACADCGLGLRALRRSAASVCGVSARPASAAASVSAAADRHVASWCDDRGARARPLGGDSIAHRRRKRNNRWTPAGFHPRPPAVGPGLTVKTELVKHTTTPRGDHGTSAARQASCISAAGRHGTPSLTCHSPVTHGRRGAGELSCFDARDWLIGAVPLWWVHFGVECSPIYLLAAARAFERSFFATWLGSGLGVW